MRKGFCLLVFITTYLLSGCNNESPQESKTAQQKAKIIAVNYPLFYMSKKLAADLAEVTLPVPADIDPAQWQPQLEDVIKLQSAELVILNGAGYSNWLNKVTLFPSKLVDSSATAKSQYIELTKQPTHSHGPAGEHSHAGYAFTTWMDLSLAKQQASMIAEAMEKRWPEQSNAIQSRKLALLQELTTLDEQYQIQAKKLTDRNLFYSHPVYQYFEQRYQLPGYSFHWEPEEMPSEQQWKKLEQLMAKSSNNLFVWEDEPSSPIADRMKAIGLEFVVIRPAANRSDNDWLTEQQLNLQRLEVCCQ